MTSPSSITHSKPAKATIIGVNDAFPEFSLGQKVSLVKLSFKNSTYEMTIDETLRVFFQIRKVTFSDDDEPLLEGYLTDNERLGLMAFKLDKGE